MLDLDAIAERRAQALKQTSEAWRRAIWSTAFQKLSQGMSDGEVETFVAYCTSVAQFEAVVKFIEQRCAQSQAAPFSVVTSEAEASGQSPQAWFSGF
ncbi:MAG: hypothetical protein QM773_13215 [Hyphomonadaceae bacterium]